MDFNFVALISVFNHDAKAYLRMHLARCSVTFKVIYGLGIVSSILVCLSQVNILFEIETVIQN